MTWDIIMYRSETEYRNTVADVVLSRNSAHDSKACEIWGEAICLHQINTRVMLFHISYKKKFMVTTTASRLGFHVAMCVKLCVHKRTRYYAKNNLWCGWIYWCDRLNFGTVANASASYSESEHVSVAITFCRLVFGEVTGGSSVTVVTSFWLGLWGSSLWHRQIISRPSPSERV
jgi:hypothetical protein